MITINSRLHFKDIETGLAAIAHNTKTLLILKYIGYLQILVGLVTLILAATRGKMNFSSIYMIAMGLFFVYWLKLLATIQTKKLIKAAHPITEQTMYTFSPEGYEVTAETYSAKNSWQKIHQVKEIKDLVLIFTSKQVAIIIPKIAFANFEAFKTLIKSVDGLKSKWL